MATNLTLKPTADGGFEWAAPEPAPLPAKVEPQEVHLARGMDGLKDEILPAVGGGVVALVVADVVSGIGGGTTMLKVAGKGAAAWAVIKFSHGKDWGKYAGAFLIFDAALDLFPLQNMVSGVTGGLGGLFGGAAGPTQTIQAAQEGGNMSIDQLYSYLRRNA